MNVIQGFKNTIEVDKSLSDYYHSLYNYDLSIEHCKKIIETTSNIQSILESDNNFKEQDKIELEKIIDEIQEKLIILHYSYAENSFSNKLYEKAINLYKYVLANDIDSHIIFYKIAYCFKNLGQIDSAILFFEKSKSINKDYLEPYLELGDLYNNFKNDLFSSIINYEGFINNNQSNSLVYNMLGFLYNRTSEIEKSYKSITKANELDPTNETILSNLLFTIQKIPINQPEIYNLSTDAINKYLELKNIKQYIHNKTEKKENNKIHIAYLSGDFNDHVIMLYLLPILENHNKEKFIVTCYSNTPFEEEDSFSIKAEIFSNNFKNISTITNEDLAEIIYNDKIDILIDLSGHTAKNRIFSLLYKPAPIIISYMGFPNTTAMNVFDYFLSNKNLNNPEEEKFYSEKIYYLDSCYRCFKPAIENLPEILELPCLKNNYITFGVFNDLSKINETVIKTWSEILNKLSNSKLFICRTTIIEEFLIKKFEAFGIDKSRLIFDKKFTFEKYNLVDIHLDTFPYSGVTVIFDSAIMGVPTLTLKGDTFAGREAYNINLHLGLNDFIALDHNEYVSKAIELSNNLDRLKELKLNLREIYKNSVFSDYKGFTNSIEKAYVGIWNNYLC